MFNLKHCCLPVSYYSFDLQMKFLQWLESLVHLALSSQSPYLLGSAASANRPNLIRPLHTNLSMCWRGLTFIQRISTARRNLEQMTKVKERTNWWCQRILCILTWRREIWMATSPKQRPKSRAPQILRTWVQSTLQKGRKIQYLLIAWSPTCHCLLKRNKKS